MTILSKKMQNDDVMIEEKNAQTEKKTEKIRAKMGKKKQKKIAIVV